MVSAQMVVRSLVITIASGVLGGLANATSDALPDVQAGASVSLNVASPLSWIDIDREPNGSCAQATAWPPVTAGTGYGQAPGSDVDFSKFKVYRTEVVQVNGAGRLFNKDCSEVGQGYIPYENYAEGSTGQWHWRAHQPVGRDHYTADLAVRPNDARSNTDAGNDRATALPLEFVVTPIWFSGAVSNDRWDFDDRDDWYRASLAPGVHTIVVGADCEGGDIDVEVVTPSGIRYTPVADWGCGKEFVVFPIGFTRDVFIHVSLVYPPAEAGTAYDIAIIPNDTQWDDKLDFPRGLLRYMGPRF